ncbi:hypothetical protein IC582_022179 [Cucumis melo]|uniref:DUF1639 family protein n=2 Tax=Cucumis melo TaxID=3656 RepID=A0A5A7TJQ0_CUCMM|nr:DUF1639 family protein [Cucumis melo var. makuwa]
MATGPVKSQPLHNFALPFLKWGGKNQTNSNHRIRRAIGGGGGDSSPAVDHSEPESEADSKPQLRVGSRTVRNRLAFSPCSLGDKFAKHSEGEVGDEVVKEQKREGEEIEGEETVQKPWNLRPRKGTSLRGYGDLKNGGDLQEMDGAVSSPAGASQQGENPQPKSLRLRGFTESHRIEKKDKRKFWIALSRDEIEEDIFIMTGSRPSRRPKKRPKNVQKQLDTVFPGLWLVGVTADSYRLADSPAKR